MQLAPTDVGSAGGNLSHINIMPVLAIGYIIALFGIHPQFNCASEDSMDAFIGEIRLFPFNYVPYDWL